MSSTERVKVNYETQKCKVPQFYLSFPQLKPKQYKNKGHFNWQLDMCFKKGTDLKTRVGKGAMPSFEEAKHAAIVQAFGPDQSKWPSKTIKGKDGKPKKVPNIQNKFKDGADNEKLHEELQDCLILRGRRFAHGVNDKGEKIENRFPLELIKLTENGPQAATVEDFKPGDICTAVLIIEAYPKEVQLESGKTIKQIAIKVTPESICRVKKGITLSNGFNAKGAYADDEYETSDEDDESNYNDDSGDEGYGMESSDNEDDEYNY